MEASEELATGRGDGFGTSAESRTYFNTSSNETLENAHDHH